MAGATVHRVRLTRIVPAITLAGGLLAAPLAAQPQPVGKAYRIGFLGSGSRDGSSAMAASFRQGLSELGYLEGRNLRIEWRFADGHVDRIPGLARELGDLKVDLVVSPDGESVFSLKGAVPTIPIVMAGADQVVERGLVVSLGRPGGNVTGLVSLDQELEAKRMELVKESVPGVSLVAILLDRLGMVRREGQAPVTRLERWGLSLIRVEIHGPDEFEAALALAARERARALSLGRGPMFYAHRRRLAELATKHRLACVGPDREYTEAGCLMSYGADRRDLARRSASYVDRILRGAKPADLPIEQPTKFELVINLNTARALGLTIPPTVLVRADEVVQ